MVPLQPSNTQDVSPGPLLLPSIFSNEPAMDPGYSCEDEIQAFLALTGYCLNLKKRPIINEKAVRTGSLMDFRYIEQHRFPKKGVCHPYPRHTGRQDDIIIVCLMMVKTTR